MIKTLTFWCPYVGDVGTVKAVIESAKSFSKSNKYKCKIFNSYGEFDKYRLVFKKNNIEEIKLIDNRLIYKLPKEGFFWSRFNYILIFIFCFFPFLFYLARNQKDYLFIYLITSLPLLLVSLFNLNNKIIFRVSGKIKFTLFRKFIYSISKKKIKKILIQTLESKNRILKMKIFDKKILNIVRDPIIDHKRINKLKKEKIESKFLNKSYFVSIGRLTEQKNFIFLAKCINQIIKKKKNFLFLIIGEGNDRIKIERYIKEFSLSKYIILTGYKKNIFKYISCSSGLICTSLWEEPGFVIQEAAACKKIILTSDCYTGPAEFINYGKNGYVFKSNNQKSFIKNFDLLINQKKQHMNKINQSYNNTNLYTKEYFFLNMKKIL
jgi:glycosyltransferase involved in cell wall biosynthesis